MESLYFEVYRGFVDDPCNASLIIEFQVTKVVKFFNGSWKCSHLFWKDSYTFCVQFCESHGICLIPDSHCDMSVINSYGIYEINSYETAFWGSQHFGNLFIVLSLLVCFLFLPFWKMTVGEKLVLFFFLNLIKNSQSSSLCACVCTCVLWHTLRFPCVFS